uniref:Uncharacterized protein n=1 Tax=viral metagenome TaxID=1070528 RepID=A0A6C0C2F5_9ZZZZ
MSRFGRARDYVNAATAQPISIESPAIGNNTMSAVAMPSQAPPMDPYSYSQGVPQGQAFDASSYYAPQNVSPNPDLPEMGQSGMQDPYAFSSQASSVPQPLGIPPAYPGNVAPTTAYLPPSPAVSDPYAPGGAFASPAPLAPPSAAPFAPPTSAPTPPLLTGKPKSALHTSSSKFGVTPPKALPTWVKWLSIAVLVGIIGAVIYRLAKNEYPPPPTPQIVPDPLPVTHPPPVACPPKTCAPVAPCPQKETVLRLSKDDPTLKVQLMEPKHHEHDHDRHSHCEGRESGPVPSNSAEDRKPSPPIVIVNEVPRAPKPQEVLLPVPRMPPSEVPVIRKASLEPPLPQMGTSNATPEASADSWGLTYAGSGSALPRISDTNMVYTQIGGAF